MKRRTAIKNTAFAFGGILSASVMSSLFESCTAPAVEDVWKPDFLSVEQGQIVTRIADILIPTTDTPGAVDALVPQFVDLAAKLLLSEEEQKQTEAGFSALNDACKKMNGKAFLDCSEEEQFNFLKEEEKVAMESDGPTLFGGLKQIIYQGFFNSEIGCTEVLKYDPVPGNYDGCIPYSEVNGTWYR